LMEECQIEDNSQYYTYLDNYAARRYVWHVDIVAWQSKINLYFNYT
jgi:hypothetical protein